MYPNGALLPLVADVTDRARMEQIYAEHRPSVVIHAAAHKHVDMMERNPGEAVKNNTFGTDLVADLAGKYRADSFVFVSTDKAVRPSCVMGASKRLAEMVIRHHEVRYAGTKFISVRFGNVMGSSGSVVQIFKEQLAKGGPVTVTHQHATRYFMTIPEAARLVLTAGAIGEGGEVMVLDMGQPIRIIDLARNLIRLSGYSDDDIPIEITGLKPGEKVNEDLYTDAEDMELTRHPKIFIGHTDDFADIDLLLRTLRDLTSVDDPDAIRRFMHGALGDSQLLARDQAEMVAGPRIGVGEDPR